MQFSRGILQFLESLPIRSSLRLGCRVASRLGEPFRSHSLAQWAALAPTCIWAAPRRLRRYPGHLTAFFRAAAARLGTSLAVFVLVLLALGTARVAHFGAEPAQVDREPCIAAHPGRGCPADLRAIAIQSDALGHLLHMCFAQTGGRTLLARLGALDTRFNTRDVSMVNHDESPRGFTMTEEGGHPSNACLRRPSRPHPALSAPKGARLIPLAATRCSVFTMNGAAQGVHLRSLEKQGSLRFTCATACTSPGYRPRPVALP